MKKLLTTFIILSMFIWYFAETTELVILHTSDLHGNVLPVDYATNEPSNVGLGKLATIIKQIRENFSNVLLIDSGDLIQGTPLEYYHARIDNTSVDPMILIMNKLGYSAWTIGNHDFDYGLNVLSKAISEAQFSALSANIVKKGTNDPVFQPYHIVNIDDIKVGILGLTTKYVPNWEDPNNIKEIEFLDPIEVAKKYIDILKNKEKVDILIVSYHGGLERDPKTGTLVEERVGENQAYQLLQEIPEIDVLLLGHQHKVVATKINNIPVSMPGKWGQYLGKIVLKLENDNGKWKVVDSTVEEIPVKDFDVDDEVLFLVREYEMKVQEWLDQPIGYAKGDFWIENPLLARLEDNSLIEFINKVQMYWSQVKISSTALFNDDIKGWKEGPITVRDIYEVYVHPYTLKVLKVKGKDIKAALEKSAEYFVYENYKVRINTNWSDYKHYDYDMWEGIDYKIVLNNPVGERIIDLMFENAPLDMEQEYEIVLNSYRVSSEEYGMFKDKPVVREVMLDVPELIANFILDHKVINASVDHNWTTVIRFEYVVNSGETLWEIAQRLGVSISDLISWNNIKNPDLIVPGMKLVYYRNYIDTLPPLRDAIGF
ncbi:MAG: 5'-nucleotidase C-terminal domain-containing protein [Thermosipho sp. (in: Bacteria)]|nr:5'-nucleotidase C-terminal domain-containing protein [Thermosipho sp. (in: thermotogales)]